MPKLVIIVLVVVAVLFILATRVRFGQGTEVDHENPPRLVTKLGGTPGSHLLRVEGDVRSAAAPASPTVLTISPACQLEVPSRSAFSGPLRVTVRPLSGSSVQVTMIPSRGKQPDPAVVPASDGPCFESAVDHGGAVLELVCQ